MTQKTDLSDTIVASRYDVHEKIGEGGMGSVYRATDRQLYREVALKVLRHELVARPETRQRLEQECRLMAKLDPHPNIVTLFDRTEHDGDVVLVMEFVAGEMLESVLERMRIESDDARTVPRIDTPELAGIPQISLSQQEVLDVARQCLEALDFAHSRGVIHRDIKPSNILISRDVNGNIRAKLTDFGIAKAFQLDGDDESHTSLTRAGGPGPGTPAYMAPEQIEPARFGKPGPHTDLYSVGIMLFKMLTLELPFTGTFTELLHAHTNLEPPDPRKFRDNISPELVAILRKALMKDPKARYADASLFALDLQAVDFQGGTVITKGKQRRAPSIAKPGSGRWVKRAAVVAGIVVVGCILGFLGEQLTGRWASGTEQGTNDDAAQVAADNREQPPPGAASSASVIPPLAGPTAVAADPAIEAQRRTDAEHAGGAARQAQEAAEQRYNNIDKSGAVLDNFELAKDLLAQGNQAFDVGQYAMASERFRLAIASFDALVPPPAPMPRPAVETPAAQPAPRTAKQEPAKEPEPKPEPVETGSEHEAKVAKASAQAAKQDKDRIFDYAPHVDRNRNAKYTEATKKFSEAEDALAEGRYSAAEKAFKEAQKAYIEAQVSRAL